MVTINKASDYMIGTDLHKMLNILFSATLSAADKTRILQENFGIPVNREVEEGVEGMCNYSSYVKDIGFNEGLSQGLSRGLNQGLSQGLSQGIAESIFELLGEVGNIPEKLKLMIEQEQDLDVLRHWRRIASKVNSIEEFCEQAEI